MPLRILVVDDNPHFRRTAVELLTLRGFEVVGEASGGQEALAAARHAQPDAVLLDINMPDLDGFAVARSLTREHPTIRIVLTSSATERVLAEDLDGSGATAFVPKAELATCDLTRLFDVR
ncbi:response regulator [Nocardioides panacihumi]|uniref:Response regulator n=1 Tax=Nocardioides panacihumi TaxID=400774 RepID=A0ABN2RU49_9ACTN